MCLFRDPQSLHLFLFYFLQHLLVSHMITLTRSINQGHHLHGYYFPSDSKKVWQFHRLLCSRPIYIVCHLSAYLKMNLLEHIAARCVVRDAVSGMKLSSWVELTKVCLLFCLLSMCPSCNLGSCINGGIAKEMISKDGKQWRTFNSCRREGNIGKDR